MKKLFHIAENKILKFLIGFLIIFIPLYPKLPSIGINNTWVYIRLEDFVIAVTVLVWLIQLVRKKIILDLGPGIPIFIYWLAGLCSLAFSLIFIGPHLANFYPKVAALSYFRRIEYMILFFVAMSTIRSIKDLRDYLVILAIALIGICLYGFGQRYYLYFWHLFPSFFEKYPFCFPSYQTGNEEFAKGIPLCLPSDARIPSTFAGHYDLAAYLVLVIPVMINLIFAVKRFFVKSGLFIISLCSLMLLIFTASRVSFVACVLSIVFGLLFYNRKKFIIPWVLIVVALLVIFNGSTAKRLLETVRLTSIVTNSQGQVVGEAESSLPASLRSKISKNPVIVGNVPTQNLPKGSGFISLPQTTSSVATNTAVVQTSLSVGEAKQLKLQNGGVEISTVSGTFLVQKALVYDISFTTRLQAEWPNAWLAFLRNPPLGSGFSSITLATDNDYLRALGESGILGFLSFFSIFLILGILVKEGIKKVDSPLTRGYVLGLSGGMIGIFLNASLIDVFEASKLAETAWILLGIAAGILLFYNKEKIRYFLNLKKFFSSNTLLVCYLLLISLVALVPSINNFFVGDDFTWLHWAATSTLGSLKEYFTIANGFFYRPLDKILMFFLYTFFSFQPQGYHLFIIFLHFLCAAGIYILGLRLFKKKVLAFSSAVLFILLPSSGENIFWISSISITLSTLFIIYGLIFMADFRSKGRIAAYLLAILFEALALLSYEMALIFPLLLAAADFTLFQQKKTKKLFYSYIPFVILIPAYLIARFFAKAVWPSGSYGYNLSHLVPNFFGNLAGYLALFIFGEKSIPFYTMFRIVSKSHSVFILAVLLLILVIFLISIFLKRRKIALFIIDGQGLIISFCFSLSVIALLPFLGLGNISERYGYLSSVGFVFLAVYCLDGIIKKVVGKKERLSVYIFLLFVIFWSLWNYFRISAENSEWNKAGQITNKALSVFRVYYPDIPKNSNIYIANVPIKYENAWVFPVGLKDGLWFIYRTSSINVYEVKDLKGLTSSGDNFIFRFNKDGDILRIKNL